MKKFLSLVGATLAVGIAGCGGGGGGTAGTVAGGTRASVPVFVTDSPETENDHVWATLYKVEVQNGSGRSETVFDDPAGHAIDLKSLRDAAGQRFAFLSNGTVSSGQHTGVRVTLASSLTLFPRGSTTGQTVPLDDSIGRDSQGHALVSFPLGAPRNLASGSDDVVIDFDLANFAQRNGKILPALREGGMSGLQDRTRHEREDHGGTVSNLSGTAPNLTFTLTVAGTAVTVVTDATTVFFNSNSAPNPALANGQTVEVTGAFDTVAKHLTATSVKIEDSAQHAGEAEAEGAPSATDATAGTFSVATQKVRGFVPAQTTVKVVTSTTTVLRSSGGVVLVAADFFTALSTAQKVEVEGTYDAASNTLTAARAKIDDAREGAENHEGEAQGTATNVQAGTGTFTLQPVTEFDGFELSGKSINVITNGGTRFRSDSATVTAAAFFAALATTQTVKAEGTFSSGTFTASSVRIVTGNSGDNGGGNNGGGNNGGGHDDGHH